MSPGYFGIFMPISQCCSPLEYRPNTRSRTGFRHTAPSSKTKIIVCTTCSNLAIARTRPVLCVHAKFKVLGNRQRVLYESPALSYEKVVRIISTLRVRERFFSARIVPPRRYRGYFDASLLSVLRRHCTLSPSAKYGVDRCCMRRVLKSHLKSDLSQLRFHLVSKDQACSAYF